jgi:hypothetical protein
VLLKYKLLEWQKIEIQSANRWIAATPALQYAAKHLNMDMDEFVQWLPQALVKSGAAKLEGAYLINHESTY